MSHYVTGKVAEPGEETPQSRADYYRTVCGLDARVLLSSGRIVIRGGSIAAFTVPSALGMQVKALLKGCFGRNGPIISHPRSHRWTFFADRTGVDLSDLTVHAQLFRQWISVVPVGGQIMLPSPADLQVAYRTWNLLPPNDFRPTADAVLDVIRNCVGNSR
ncbi:hypothetical protein [Nocardia sp. BMG51109]|uniref:hypothetical protein n=1 Tax=Nocardia sp. BMG51109 TaxID=1056816 RepID=UPI00055BBD84|nr:hypothetical protein [Nocardia sp. BMG51109]